MTFFWFVASCHNFFFGYRRRANCAICDKDVCQQMVSPEGGGGGAGGGIRGGGTRGNIIRCRI